jgi:phage anti-repressor protein
MTTTKSKVLVSASSKAAVYELPIIQQGENLLISAILLHKKLRVKTKFSDWIKSRFGKYCFESGQDYFSEISEKLGAGRKATDYLLTLDTAKELSMLEENETGRLIRRYFIQKEKEARGISHLPRVAEFFRGVERRVVNGRKVYHYVTILERCGYSVNAGCAHSRVHKYPAHFVRMGHPYYVTEEFALHLWHQRAVLNNRVALKQSQPVLPFDFGSSIQTKGGVL